MAKKPKHDPATMWSTSQQLTPQQALQRLAQPSASGLAGLSASYYGQSASDPRRKWGDVEVGETVPISSIAWPSDSKTEYIAQVAQTIITWPDGSEGVFPDSTAFFGTAPMVTKTRGAAPVLTPDEVEETSEVITGWRLFSIRDYKLKGTWCTWESRTFHASCNCEEYKGWQSPFRQTSSTVFQTRPDTRDRMRAHLAAGRGTCGVYSRTTLRGRFPFYPKPGDDVQVAARCVNYGFGYAYDAGYRSEFCRIEHLYLLAPERVLNEGGAIYWPPPGDTDAARPSTIAQMLSITYGVPCDVVKPLEFAWKHDEGLL